MQETADTSGSDSNPQVNEKLVKEREKELLHKFKPIFHEYLHEHVDLQIISIYALQAVWFALKSPKGTLLKNAQFRNRSMSWSYSHSQTYRKFVVVLLRWFMNLYELDIIEEEALLKWKEDIRDDFPGKGQALFQVNQWLQLLQEANESDGESEEE